jgi:arylsulfatase A-like enzyme
MKVLNLFNSLDMKIQPNEKSIEYSGGHRGYDAQTAWKQLFNSLTDEQRQVWNAAYKPKNRAFLKENLTGEELAKWKYQRYIKDYLRCVASVDDNIGRLLDYLDKEALTKNTLIIYTSDQGFYLGEHGWYDKRFMYEESFSTPLILCYPKEITPGTVSKDLVLNLDFCPTILNYAGVEIPAGVQGESLKPLTTGETPTHWRKSIYYHYYEYPHGWHQVKKHYGIRTAKYKLIHFYDDIDAWELYDLEKDPKELNNIFGHADYLEIQNSLTAELVELRKHFLDGE